MKWLAWGGIIIVVAVYFFWGICLSIFKGEHSKAENIFEAITALAAIIAICVAKYQIHVYNQSQKRATADDIYSGYLKLAIEHPDVSRPEQKSEDSKNPGKYDAFVTYLLYAAEKILELYPEDKNWNHALKLDLAHHRDFLRSRNYLDDAYSYDEALRKLVKEMLIENEIWGKSEE